MELPTPWLICSFVEIRGASKPWLYLLHEQHNLAALHDSSIPEDEKEYKGEVFDDNLLHQLQRMMAHLELSERQDYNPKGFCFSFKEFDGAPTNTAE